MKQHMEILIIPFRHISAGIDAEEIIGVYSSTGEKGRELLMQKEKSCFDLSFILTGKKETGNNSLIHLKQNDSRDFFAVCPPVEGVASFDTDDIFIMPGLVRRIQNPFFTWGLINSGGTNILLITFFDLREEAALCPD